MCADLVSLLQKVICVQVRPLESSYCHAFLIWMNHLLKNPSVFRLTLIHVVACIYHISRLSW